MTAVWTLPFCPRYRVRRGAGLRPGRAALILKPTYKTGWTIPGGVMEADGETPWDACRREVREECGLEVRGGRLAASTSAPAARGTTSPGGIRFLFDCGASRQRRPGRDHGAAGRDRRVPPRPAGCRAGPCSGRRSGAASAPERGAAGACTWKTAARSPASPSAVDRQGWGGLDPRQGEGTTGSMPACMA